jgi:two-component system, LytTR family, response regulator
MLRAIIIDDEEAGIETLKILTERNSALIRIIATTLKAEEGITLIDDYRPDVVFLDINMPNMSGFELLDKLSFRDFKLVFTTAHREYAIAAIKNRAFDYLLKPIDDGDFKNCLEALLKTQKNIPNTSKTETPAVLEIQVKDGIIYLKQKDIVRLEASRSYTDIYMDNGVKHIASKTLKDFEQKLDHHLFFRCHKSHVVNLQKVQKFVNHDGFYAVMNDGSSPERSKAMKDIFLDRLKSI